MAMIMKTSLKDYCNVGCNETEMTVTMAMAMWSMMTITITK